VFTLRDKERAKRQKSLYFRIVTLGEFHYFVVVHTQSTGGGDDDK
jgi:hypothetical protein